MEKYLKKYINDFKNLISSSENILNDLLFIKDHLISASKKGKKTIIVGNGGSAAMASHFSVDITKNAGIRCINFIHQINICNNYTIINQAKSKISTKILQFNQ